MIQAWGDGVLPLGNLIQFLKDKYSVDVIEKLPKKYDYAYTKQKVLPSNIEQIDTQLKKVYYSNRYLKIFSLFSKKD